MSLKPELTRFEAEFVAGYVYGRLLTDLGVKLTAERRAQMRAFIDEAMIMIGQSTTIENEMRAELDQLLREQEDERRET